MTARSLRGALPRFAALTAATGAVLVVWFSPPASAGARAERVVTQVRVAADAPAEGEKEGEKAEGDKAEGEKEGEKEGEAHGGEVVVAPLITNVDGDDTGYVAAGAIGAVTLVGVAAAIASDRKRGGATAGGAHH